MNNRFVKIMILVMFIILGSVSWKLLNQPSLNVLNWDFYIGKRTLETYQTKTSVKVNYKIYDSNEQARDFIIQSPGIFDIVIPSDYMMDFLIKENLLHPLSLDRLDNLKNVSESAIKQFKKKGWLKYCVPYLFGSTGFAINRDEVKVSATQISWQMLARDAEGEQKFKNKLVILDDSRQVLGSILLELGFDPNSTKTDQLNEAVRLLQRVKPIVLEFSSDTGKDKMLNGEAWIAFAWSGDALQVAAKSPSWQYGIPASGGLKFQDGVCMPKNPPNIDSAYTFINNLLDENVHAEIVETTKYLTTNSKALAQLPIKQKEIQSKVAESKEPLYFVRDLGDEGARIFEKAWERVKG